MGTYFFPPEVVLYEGQGIDLYDNITRDPTYYLYRNELSILEEYGDDIVRFRLSLFGQYTNVWL